MIRHNRSLYNKQSKDHLNINKEASLLSLPPEHEEYNLTRPISQELSLAIRLHVPTG